MFHDPEFRKLLADIGHLGVDARQALREWFYSQSWNDEEADGVAEAAVRYETSFASVEEYLKEESLSAIRHEYVGGEEFAMSGASVRHNVICGNVFRAVAHHLKGGSCMAFMENMKVALRAGDATFVYYPDVMVACGKRDLRAVHLEDPKLVVEVLSPSTARVDKNEKALNYRRIPTLEEYVLIAQYRHKITVQRRRNGWQSWTCTSPEGTLDLESIGLSIQIAEIYESAFQGPWESSEVTST